MFIFPAIITNMTAVGNSDMGNASVLAYDPEILSGNRPSRNIETLQGNVL
jgi:hypothetical protein